MSNFLNKKVSSLEIVTFKRWVVRNIIALRTSPFMHLVFS